MSNLKPCPFCGGEATFRKFKGKKRLFEVRAIAYYVQCDSCGISTGVEFEGDIPVRKWNRRTDNAVD